MCCCVCIEDQNGLPVAGLCYFVCVWCIIRLSIFCADRSVTFRANQIVVVSNCTRILF